MRGKLSETPVADIARQLSNDEVTGALEVDGAAGVARVFFRTGDVYWAMSPAPRARLGDRLVNAGFITQEQLEQALETQRHAEERTKLGALLVDQRLVSRDVIRVFVQEQILDALFDLVRWDEGDWTFHPGDAVEDKLPIDIPVSQLLVEASRRQSEWDQIQRTIPTLDAVPDHVIGGNATTAALEQDEFTMLASIDGNRSVRELAGDLGYSEFEAARIVYGLTLLGIVEILGDDADEETHDAAGEVEPGTAVRGPGDAVEEPRRQRDLDAALADVLDTTDPTTDPTADRPPTPAADTSDDDIDVGEALEHALFGEPEPPAEPVEHVRRRDDDGLQVTVHFSLDDGVGERSAHGRPGSAEKPAPDAPAAPAAGDDEPEPWVFSAGQTGTGERPVPEAPAPREPARTEPDPDLDEFDDLFRGPATPDTAGEPSPPDAADELDPLVADLMDDAAAEDEPGHDEPQPAAARGGRGDVSELLRELTQLNLEDEDEPSEHGRGPDADDAPAAPPRRQPPRDDRRDDKRKKGLFGWGR